ncbi:hypothetical protein SteCoe_14130 [Stentor coeruleus]|uniref:Uncharacterized protein n=1 Tax=Stentor coeruleus TaxID=5963 RepID=A0A1R2C6U3_9CILI|nr:hypothetical protein SteCoe_14130 [Stentor coeruleus]
MDSSQTLKRFSLATIEQAYEKSYPKLSEVIRDEQYLGERANEAVHDLRNFLSTLQNDAQVNELPEDQPNPAGSISQCIDSIKNSVESSKQILQNIDNIIPDKDTKTQDNQEESALKITEISYLESEKYKISIEYLNKEPLENLSVLLRIENLNIPVFTIGSLKEYSKNSYNVSIPLSTLFNNGHVQFYILDKGNEIASKDFYITEILEIVRIEQGAQLKIRNNTGMLLKCCIYEYNSQYSKDIQLNPGAIELSMVALENGDFAIAVGEKVISNRFIL